jgi:oligosaccharide reducing-end xylanase
VPRLVACAVALAAVACTSTKDSVGHNGPGGFTLKPLSRPTSYPNPFKDWLGKTDAEITARVTGAFNQLFHGDLATEAIYIPVATDQAQIYDFYHQDIRTEGIGWGMIIAVELDKRDEFDRLWRFSKNELQIQTGPNKGYFNSSCDTESGKAPCLDPFGMEQYLTALLFAHGRWGNTGAIDYAGDTIGLLDLMRHKQDANGGIVEGVTDVFDAETALPFDFPHKSAAGRSRPSVAMPAYYELWAQATGDSFWTRAAVASREYWKRSVSKSNNGLLPVRATFEGDAVSGSDSFQPEAYRAQINIALDEIWFARDPWTREVADRVLGFFTRKGFENYGTSYELDGDVLNPAREPSLISTNGITAGASTAVDRNRYVQAVWDQMLPIGPIRYYQGIVHMLALLVLSGNYRIW